MTFFLHPSSSRVPGCCQVCLEGSEYRRLFLQHGSSVCPPPSLLTSLEVVICLPHWLWHYAACPDIILDWKSKVALAALEMKQPFPWALWARPLWPMKTRSRLGYRKNAQPHWAHVNDTDESCSMETSSQQFDPEQKDSGLHKRKMV